MLLFAKSSDINLRIAMFENSAKFVKITSCVYEFLSLNLSDLYDKICLCNISDSSSAKNSIKRQTV